MPPRRGRRKKAAKFYPKQDWYDARPWNRTAEQTSARSAALRAAFGLTPDADAYPVGQHPALKAYRAVMGLPELKPRKKRTRTTKGRRRK